MFDLVLRFFLLFEAQLEEYKVLAGIETSRIITLHSDSFGTLNSDWTYVALVEEFLLSISRNSNEALKT